MAPKAIEFKNIHMHLQFSFAFCFVLFFFSSTQQNATRSKEAFAHYGQFNFWSIHFTSRRKGKEKKLQLPTTSRRWLWLTNSSFDRFPLGKHLVEMRAGKCILVETNLAIPYMNCKI